MGALGRLVFGPVPSRRLGQSLGVNNIPPETCSYSCVYCQLGRTSRMRVRRQAFYEPGDLLREVSSRVDRAEALASLHDLRLALEVARDVLRLPVGVVINKDGVGDEGVESYCREEGIPVLLRIPLDRRIAAAYSEGMPLVRALPEYRGPFRDLLAALRDLAQRGA